MTNIQQFCIKKTLTVKQAMAQLDAAGGKILFIVDENGCLEGSLTDGDVRRWILSGGALEGSIASVFNDHPYTVSYPFDRNEIKHKLLDDKLECIPVLNAQRKIENLLFWDDLSDDESDIRTKEKLDLPVVIMAGGFGTRLAPFTTVLPKPLMPVGEKTILEHIIQNFQDYSIDEYFLTVHHKSKIIRSYFEELNPPYSLTFVEEPVPLGTAGALQFLKGKITRPFIVTNCDILIKSNYADLVHLHHNNQADITMVASVKHYQIPYGICELDENGFLKEMVEKPEYHFLINTGMYILNPSVLDLIPPDTVFHMTHLVDEVKKQGGKVAVYPVSEQSWSDIGEWVEYKKTLEKLKV